MTALQRLAAERNAGIAGDRRMEWRIGIHIAGGLDDPPAMSGDQRVGGDGMLIEFSSVVGAVECSLASLRLTSRVINTAAEKHLID
jgi:hypothetical protein